ncbi:hypothetical protein Rs2_13235 [Raphanus sativus]|nr:hypothetical protein Rs2_13235 [Raphanus sativus]
MKACLSYDYRKVLILECGQGFDVDYFYLPYGGGLVPHIVEDKYDYPYDVGLFSRLGLHCYNLEKASFLAQTEISRLKVPSGPRPPTYDGPERIWNDDAVDDSYKGKMPKWFTKDEMAAISTKGSFMSCKNQTCKEMSGFICMLSLLSTISGWHMRAN